MLARSSRGHADGGPDGGGWACFWLAVCLFFPLAAFSEDENDYLKLLEQEALKVESPEGAGTGAGLNADATIEQFESELNGHYRGSFMFYKKLPRRSQEEIFLEYKKGATIEDIRQKIMNRFMHDE